MIRTFVISAANGLALVLIATLGAFLLGLATTTGVHLAGQMFR